MTNRVRVANDGGGGLTRQHGAAGSYALQPFWRDNYNKALSGTCVRLTGRDLFDR